MLQIGAVVDKPAGLLAVILHEVVFEHPETLGHSFADGDAGHHDDEFRPAVPLVHLEHRLDIDVGLSRTGLHLDVETAGAQSSGQSLGTLDVVAVLYLMDVLQQLRGVEPNLLVPVAGLQLTFIHPGLVFFLPLAEVATVCGISLRRLSGKHIDRTLHHIGLVLLYLESEFHGTLYKIRRMVSLLYALKIWSKLSSTLSVVAEASRITK